jgi:hypothetical protein
MQCTAFISALEKCGGRFNCFGRCRDREQRCGCRHRHGQRPDFHHVGRLRRQRRGNAAGRSDRRRHREPVRHDKRRWREPRRHGVRNPEDWCSLVWTGGSIALGAGDSSPGAHAGTMVNASGALIDFEGDGSANGAGFSGSASIGNAGTIVKSGGLGGTTIYAAVSNTGTAEATSETLTVEQGVSGAATFLLDGDARLDFASLSVQAARCSFCIRAARGRRRRWGVSRRPSRGTRRGMRSMPRPSGSSPGRRRSGSSVAHWR